MTQGPETNPSVSGRSFQERGKEHPKTGDFPTPQVREIEVYSEFDPSSKMLCCGKPTIQKQIDYTLTVNHELLKIPKVWANVCQSCDEPFFSPNVGTAISNAIFQLQHPLESQIAKLLTE